MVFAEFYMHVVAGEGRHRTYGTEHMESQLVQEGN